MDEVVNLIRKIQEGTRFRGGIKDLEKVSRIRLAFLGSVVLPLKWVAARHHDGGAIVKIAGQRCGHAVGSCCREAASPIRDDIRNDMR